MMIETEDGPRTIDEIEGFVLAILDRLDAIHAEARESAPELPEGWREVQS